MTEQRPVLVIAVYNPFGKNFRPLIWTSSLGVPLLLLCSGILIANILYGTAEPVTRMRTPFRPMLRSRGFYVLDPQQPTHLATTGATDIQDIALLKDISLSKAIEALHELSSDHLLVILDLAMRSQRPLPEFLRTGTDMLM
jgi:hypothetical protein